MGSVTSNQLVVLSAEFTFVSMILILVISAHVIHHWNDHHK